MPVRRPRHTHERQWPVSPRDNRMLLLALATAAREDAEARIAEAEARAIANLELAERAAHEAQRLSRCLAKLDVILGQARRGVRP